MVFPLCLLWVRWVGKFATNDKLADDFIIIGVRLDRTRSPQIIFAARGDFQSRAEKVTLAKQITDDN